MGKNVAVFVDVANVFYAAKAAGVDIDYVTLLKSVTAGRDLVRAYAYTGLDPDNENQRNFHDFLRRSGYKVVSKDIRKYGDGKVKANLDIELVVDMMKTARNLDIAIVVSGDGDFAPAIRAVQEQGVRVEVLSFRGNTSSDLMDVADLFTDIAQIAKVEKGSSRSGRRVASDDEDLSMTEVPDKQSEGTGRPRGRGRTRTTRVGEGEAVAAPRPRSRSRAVVDDDTVAAVATNGGALIALPGEKLSKAAIAKAVSAAPAPAESDEEPVELLDGEVPVDGEEEPRRRRRRRGGRGRGRGRAHEDGLAVEGAPDAGTQPVGEDADEDDDIEDDAAEAPAPVKRPVHAFGSVWDSQIGVPTAAVGGGTAFDDEDLDEPPIPEYLIAERRQQNGRGGGNAGRGGGRGVRPGYAAAVDRERYGGRSPSAGRSVSGGSSGSSRYGEPAPRGGSREPERFRNDRPPVRPAPRVGNPDEPWSEVSPELEAMLRAQIGSRPRPPAPVAQAAVQPADSATVEAPAPKRRVTRKPAAVVADGTTVPAAEAEAPAPKRRAPRKAATVSPTVVDEATSVDAAPKRRTIPEGNSHRGNRRAGGEGGTQAPRDAQGCRANRLTSVMNGLRTRGQPVAAAAIRAMLGSGFPHAVLLTGPGGVGKTTLALDIAAALLCSGADPVGRPCRDCRTCRMVEHGNHPDVHWLSPAGPGALISIGGRDERGVRELVRDLAYLPVEGGARVAIVESAHRMTEDAQTAFLKTLEEPPPRTTIILCADDEERLLPTIHSRCVRIRLGPMGPRDIEAVLVAQGVADAPDGVAPRSDLGRAPRPCDRLCSGTGGCRHSGGDRPDAAGSARGRRHGAPDRPA